MAVSSILTTLSANRNKEKTKNEKSAESNVSYGADGPINSKLRINQGKVSRVVDSYLQHTKYYKQQEFVCKKRALVKNYTRLDDLDDYVELDDLDYSSSDESITDNEDDYKTDIRIMSVEETETEHLLHSFFERSFFGVYLCQNETISAKTEKSPISDFSSCEKEQETLERLVRFSSNSVASYDTNFAFDSFEFDSNCNSEFSVSSSVLKRNHELDFEIKDIMEVVVNDIVSNFEKSKYDLQTSEHKKGHNDFQFKTTFMNENTFFIPGKCNLRDLKKLKKESKSAKSRKRRRKTRNHSVRDILKWQTSHKRDNTVFYDVLPGIQCDEIASHQHAQVSSNNRSEDSSELVNCPAALDQQQNTGQTIPRILNHRLQTIKQEIQQKETGQQNGMPQSRSFETTNNNGRQNEIRYTSHLQSSQESNGESSAYSFDSLDRYFDTWRKTNLLVWSGSV